MTGKRELLLQAAAAADAADAADATNAANLLPEGSLLTLTYHNWNLDGRQACQTDLRVHTQHW